MDKLANSKVLVVGAGGIGCELLKNLVMWNFKSITVIDLDTIDVSNLNRQFLFRKENVGKSKALVAKESVLQFNPYVNIESKHDDIMNPKYDINFYKSFNVVLNALDNKTARNHVNRMCISANIPLVEGGTMGYRGQVQVILKGRTACYECYPKPAQKQYPACTIRNTPSEPVHCVVWSKFLFNQLFGEPDVDQDVVPDQNDPELANETLENGDKPSPQTKTNIRSSWKIGNEYDPNILLKILFRDSIMDLLAMKALWEKDNRIKPEVLNPEYIEADITDMSKLMSVVTGGVRDQDQLSIYNWCQVFKHSALQLASQLDSSDNVLSWDKDDTVAMDFVAAASNIRMSVFHIVPILTRFDIKSIAGNIIPAIATTNAMIAGISVLHAYKILNGQSDECRDVMVSDFVSARGKIVQAVDPLRPVKDCYVCSSIPIVTMSVRNPSAVSLQSLKVDILENIMHMQAPNVSIQHRTSILIDGGDDDPDPEYMAKTLDQFEIGHGTVLRCSDFLQHYEFNMIVEVVPNLEKTSAVLGDVSHVLSTARPDQESNDDDDDSNVPSNIAQQQEPVTARSDVTGNSVDRKRKIDSSPSTDQTSASANKIPRLDENPVPTTNSNHDNGNHIVEEEDDDDIVMIG